jgi:hypothetical protein
MSDNIQEKYLPVGARPIQREPGYFKRLWWQRAPYFLSLILVVASLASVIFTLCESGRGEVAWARMKTILPQTKPLIASLKSYTAEHGKPPPDLQTLRQSFYAPVPEPEAGLREDWRYEVSNDPFTGGWTLSVRISLTGNRMLYNPSYLLVYHPSERYREKDHGGTLRREGKWGWYYD